MNGSARIGPAGRVAGRPEGEGWTWVTPAVPGVLASLARQVGLAGLLNGLQLSVSLLALGIYDHVLPERDLAALAALTGATLVLGALVGGLDLLRARLLFRAGLSLVQMLDRRVPDAVRRGVTGEPQAALHEALHDIERVWRFLASGGPAAFFDALWAPVFLVAMFWLHPLLGGYATAGFGLVAALALMAETRPGLTTDQLARQHALRLSMAREAAAVHTGRSPSLPARWEDVSRRYHAVRSQGADRAMRFAAAGKGLRLMLQSGGLALGALLVIEGAMSAGSLLASSILMGRMFAALDAALRHWRCLVAARAGYRRLVALQTGAPALRS
jgi:ATP-binding cassette subfamily C protein PrsD